MELMLAVELDHMGVFTAVEAQGRSQISSYVTMLMIMFGGILFIQQKRSMSNLPRLYGKNLHSLLGHITWKIFFLTRKSSPLLT